MLTGRTEDKDYPAIYLCDAYAYLSGSLGNNFLCLCDLLSHCNADRPRIQYTCGSVP